MSDTGMAERPGGLQARMAANLRSAIRPASDENVDPIDSHRAEPQPAWSGGEVTDRTVAFTQAESVPATMTPPSPAPPIADPSQTSAPASVSQRALVRRTKRHEVTVQFGTKLTLEVREELDAIADHEGLSIRDTLQMLITEYAREHGVQSEPES
jgi:hypothetical protein